MNPTLAAGEPGFETDTGKIKYGDGTTAWNSLAYAAGGGGAPTGAAGGALDGTYPNPGLAASVAGAGLAETSDVLSVNVDGSTIEINTDTLRVKADGITANEIAAGAVGASELASTAVTPATYGDATHSPQITVDADGRITAASDVSISGGGGGGTPLDGWVDDTAETWTYATGSGGGVATFTVSGDQTAKYTVGTKIKLTQTTAKYFVVTAVAFASSTTTVTIFAGSDYTLANAAISANFHSYVANPQGWPGWFTYSCAPTGFSGTPTQRSSRFSVEGRTVTLFLDVFGTSNAGTFTVQAPIAAARSFPTVSFAAVNNSANLNTGLAQSGTAPTTTITVLRDAVATAFTSGGTKGAIFTLVYEI